jgi:DegV family protein with EDD domain
MSRHKSVLYLCVGSAFTGNYRVVMDWKREHDPEDHLKVIDTGTASGRLGVIALAVSDYAFKAEDSEKVMEFSRQAISRSEEYIFLDCLEYVAAGGRLSTTGALFGDMLRMKPIVSPMAEGARRVGVVRNRKDQLHFALEALGRALQPRDKALIMLEYSDNLSWVEEVRSKVTMRYPKAQIIVHPLSLTSGSHMGPGTWAVAFLPDIQMS